MGARRERAAVRGARLVEVEVGDERVRGHLVGDEVVQQEDIGLLHDLRLGDALAPEQHVAGHGAHGEVGDPEGLESVEALELLIDPGGRVVAVDDRPSERVPILELGGIRSFQSGRPGGTTGARVSAHGGRGRAQVPTRHDVREGVVVDELVVLVGSDDATEVRAPVRVTLEPRRPETSALDEDPQAIGRREPGVPAPRDVVVDGPGDVRHDVQLPLPGPDADRDRVVAVDPGRGDVAAIGGGFPGEPGAGEAGFLRGLASWLDPPGAVREHRARGRRAGRREERQHVALGIPEHVRLVARPGEAAWTEWRLGLVRDRRIEVIQRERDRPLELRVAIHHGCPSPPSAAPRQPAGGR